MNLLNRLVWVTCSIKVVIFICYAKILTHFRMTISLFDFIMQFDCAVLQKLLGPFSNNTLYLFLVSKETNGMSQLGETAVKRKTKYVIE